MEAELVRLRAENFRLTAAGMVSGGKAEQKLTNSNVMNSAMRQLQAIDAFIAEAQTLRLASAPIEPAPANANWTPENLIALVRASQSASITGSL